MIIPLSSRCETINTGFESLGVSGYSLEIPASNALIEHEKTVVEDRLSRSAEM